MLSQSILSGVRILRTEVRRSFGIMAPALQKASDPIQQLFLDKVKEYRSKSGDGKKLVDPTPEIEKEMKNELDRIAKQYGGGDGVDMTQFPEFKFVDPKVDTGSQPSA